MPNRRVSPARQHRRHRRRARSFVLLYLIAGFALAAAAVVGVPVPVEPQAPFAAPAIEADDALVSDFAAALPPREVYRHSVINGGAYTAAELADAIRGDPVVAAHYRAIDADAVRTEAVAADEMAYMSYRRGDQIYWTKHKIRLRQGETILTDGTTKVRARCGNCISLEPMLPTAEDEPETVEFDALTEDPAIVIPSQPSLLAARQFPGLLLPPPFGTAPFESVGPLAIGPVAENFNAIGPGNPGAPIDARDLDAPGFESPGPPFPLPPTNPPGDFPRPGDQDNPSGTVDPPLTNLPPPFHPPIDVPEDFDPEDPLNPSVNPPDEPAPVPEPGTLLLIGGGGVSLLLRRLRSREGGKPNS